MSKKIIVNKDPEAKRIAGLLCGSWRSMLDGICANMAANGCDAISLLQQYILGLKENLREFEESKGEYTQ